MTNIQSNNPFEGWRRRRTPEEFDQPRLGALGELSFNAGSLMQLLRSRHALDQMDRILEFPVLGPEIVIPRVFQGKPIESVQVTLGEIMVETDVDERSLETHIGIDIRARGETLHIERSLDPNTDPADVVDTIIVTKPNQSEPIIQPIVKPISRQEINSLLVSLFASHIEVLDKFKDVDFLDPDNFIALSDELEQHAFSKEISGIYSFSDDDAELEFSQRDDYESYKITYIDKTGDHPRTIAASAASDTSFDMDFIINNGGGDIRVTIPLIQDVSLLKRVIVDEISELSKRTALEAEPFIDNVITEEQTLDEVEQRIADSEIIKMEIDELLDGIQSGEDGFDAPDSGA